MGALDEYSGECVVSDYVCAYSSRRTADNLGPDHMFLLGFDVDLNNLKPFV